VQGSFEEEIMKRDFKTWIVLLAFSLPVIAVLFIGTFYLANCGFGNNCAEGDLAGVIHTPIPTLFPATLPVNTPTQMESTTPIDCSASAKTILSAWVTAKFPQDQTFTYLDLNGNACSAKFTDLQPLFTQPNLWYQGALACTSCHNNNINASSAGLDLTSYSAILAGASGTDILGDGNWDQSILNQALFIQKEMPLDAPAGVLTDRGPVIQSGQSAITNEPTPTPAGVEEVPEPSNPGGPGQAVNLTGDPVAGAVVYKTNCATCHGDAGKGGIANLGSNDESVPPVNPIDPLLKDPNYLVFATNIDLFIQHGSTPEGVSPFRNMPGWGDKNAITQQQIADVIAYIIGLNK
jgi:mono/diheme cytochrome c family protein